MLLMRDRALEQRWSRRRSHVLPGAGTQVFDLPHARPRADQARAIGPALAWERLQEQAALAFQAGEGGLPARNWAAALELAENHFDQADPRLAASLTNYGHVLQQTGRQHQAIRLFTRAADGWAKGWRWVRRMAPPPGTPPYDEEARDRFLELLHLGQRASAAIARMEPLALDGLHRFQATRPQRMSDLRCLLAAVCLLVPGPGDRPS